MNLAKVSNKLQPNLRTTFELFNLKLGMSALGSMAAAPLDTFTCTVDFYFLLGTLVLPSS
jgi:hypothetical protein